MLEQVSLFANLAPNEIAELEAVCKEHSFPKNSMVINAGDETDCLYVICSGKAVALHTDDSGRQFIVNRFDHFDYFGEMSLLDRGARCASVMTKEKSTLLILPRKAFFDFAETHPQVFRNVIDMLLGKLRKATEQIRELALVDVQGRLAHFLMAHQNADGIVEEKFTHQELADIVGSSRETVCRIFNELVEDGYIIRENGHIKIQKKMPDTF